MGYLKHHAIVVTSWRKEAIEEAHAKALEIFVNFDSFMSGKAWVSPISEPGVNGQRSFFVAPDGSKEGWSQSVAGDEQRKEFCDWLESVTMIDWCEVVVGDEADSPRVIRSHHGYHDKN